MKNNLKALLVLLMATLQVNAFQNQTLLMHSPAVGKDHIAFIYAEDLWVAQLDGTNPRRLTVDEGVESNPVFSPDGQTIAFSAQYDGNIDVFTVSVAGGIPQRLTWHPYTDAVRDFTPDGKHVLFTSQRNSFTNRYTQLFTVPITGGQVTQLDIPHGFFASISGDGAHIAYTTIPDRFLQWKNYRGGTQTRIWIYNTSDHEVAEIPKPSNGSNDTQPQWLNGKVYFRSDRNGEFNIYSYDPANQEVQQHTSFEDFPVLNINANGDKLIFEQAGALHTLNAGGSQTIPLNFKTDLLELRSRFVSGNNYIRGAHISPSGARAVFDFRGEIVTVPAEKGDIANLTLTTGVHEKYPKWSPNGKQIAYFSDESGEYGLHLKSTQSGAVRKISLDGSGFYAAIHWSPDSKHLTYVDNARNLYLLNTNSGVSKKIATDYYYVPGSFRDLYGSWSHDSKYIAYTIISDTNYERAYIYSLDQGNSYAVSDGLSNVSEPRFDPSGKYLYLLASTDAGPVVNWFDQSNQDMQMSSSIYLITLQKDTKSPLFKENDEESGEEESDADETEEPKKGKKSKMSEPTESGLTIDWLNMHQRIIDLPIPPGMYRSLQVPKEGQLYYLARTANSRDSKLHKFDLEKRKDESLIPADGYVIAHNGEKMLSINKGSWAISAVGKAPENGALKTAAIQVKIDPKSEWQNIFNEAWRVNRDYFYDPGMHGADWPAMKTKYQAFLEHVSCRSDLYRVMQWMCSELAVGHHRFGSRGDRLNNPQTVNGGLLGADYKVSNGRYQFEKIYGGLNWTPELRSPLTEPGVNIAPGEYLLAVNGIEVSASQNLFSYFENTAEKIVTLTVGPNPNFADSRKVEVVPLRNEYALRNRDWVEGNMKKVHEATDGQVAYVYVPNTAGLGHQYFKRYFFPQANKKAIIIDERFNGGGQLADYYIDILRKPYQSNWNFRYGADLKAPSASIQGPKVMLIDETAGSGGDYLPWMFRKFKLGTLIGNRTWGGLVGVLGYPEFIDGGSVTAPNVAFYSENGFRVENEGVAPDLEVEQWPKQVIAGEDPQLDKAIEVVLKELEDYQSEVPERPDYPVRVRD